MIIFVVFFENEATNFWNYVKVILENLLHHAWPGLCFKEVTTKFSQGMYKVLIITIKIKGSRLRSPSSLQPSQMGLTGDNVEDGVGNVTKNFSLKRNGGGCVYLIEVFMKKLINLIGHLFDWVI